MQKQEKRFNMYRKPNKPRGYLKLVEYIAAPFYMWFNNGHVKTEKAVKKIKGPYLVLASHASFMDFAQMVCGIMPRTSGWVMSVEEFRRGDWLMYGIGGMPKRKFTHDIVTAKHVMRYIKTLKHTCTIYPEARFSLAGINERLDDALGKLCKHLKVPVVLFKANGNFLNSPQWCKRPYRKIRQEAEITLLASAEEVQNLTADELQARIEKGFERDEYKWNSEHTKLWCDACGATWEMDTLSRLHGVNTEKGFSHVPDWYRWEREEVRKEVQAGTYHFEDDVRVEDYYSTKKGFVTVGDAHMVHDENGFTFTGTDLNGQPISIHKPVSSMYSVHIEYDFLNRGDAIDIATEETSYFMFLKTAKNYLTKMHFAQEELYNHYVKK